MMMMIMVMMIVLMIELTTVLLFHTACMLAAWIGCKSIACDTREHHTEACALHQCACPGSASGACTSRL